ncbi:pirin family protein [Micromonospora sp. WMMD956]|jgi:redox-sensitive bicupin YhaK (pirin superfamily)|uniref:pirin family protein n=1 Tax=Micromonospora TaxID=1873 RepID=UPI0024166898|nr:pirin family protein [Micromonospora sp. WMMD956]MDG4814970.1 pirin family protein [Micromonospora sp. WMMD956]
MSATPTPRVDVRRADDRYKTDIAWLDSKHSFSFGNHWSADNTHHGLLLVNNDDVVRAGTGFETHPHRDILFVPRGAVTLEGSGALGTADAVRFTATGGQRVTATEPAEILVWEMHATVAG